jgi:hypothetical protein
LRVRLQIGLSHPHPVYPEQWLDEVNTSTRLLRKFHNTLKVTQHWVRSYPYESCSQSQSVTFIMNHSDELPWLIWSEHLCSSHLIQRQNGGQVTRGQCGGSSGV